MGRKSEVMPNNRENGQKSTPLLEILDGVLATFLYFSVETHEFSDIFLEIF